MRQLFAHQKRSLQVLSTQPRVLDFSDPGTGKTTTEICDFSGRRHSGGGCALIFAPKMLLTNVWEREFFVNDPMLRISAAYAKNREEAFQVEADAYVTNHDAAAWVAAQPPSFFKRFDTLILDESTAFKHASSQRAKALRKIVPYFEFRRALTGTPNSNGICDVWHQALLVDDGRRLGRSFFQFRAATCTPVQVGPSPQHLRWEDRPGSETAVAQLLADITIRHRLEDCVDIPQNHAYAVECPLDRKHRQAYEQLKKDALLVLKDASVTAVNAAVLYTKLLQCVSGAVYNDAGAYSVIDTSRYELIMDLVEARQNSVVFFQWRHQKEQLVKLAQAGRIPFAVLDGTTSERDRATLVQQFQDGAFRVLFAHPQSAGHGLTLTRATSTIWASPTYNLEHYLQGLRRIYRIGQTERTETIVVTAPDTIDVAVWEALQVKNVRMDNLLNFLLEAS